MTTATRIPATAFCEPEPEVRTPSERVVRLFREACVDTCCPDWVWECVRGGKGQRSKSVVAVTHRQLVFYRLRQYGLSYPEIGAVTKTPHTTVLYAVRREDELRAAKGRA